MAANTSPIFPLTPKTSPVTVVNADGTTKKTLITAGANGTKIDAIKILSDDTTTVTLSFYLTKSGTDYLVGTVAVTAGTGVTPGTSPAEALEYLNDGYALALEAGVIVKVAVAVSVTSGKTVTVVAHAGDF